MEIKKLSVDEQFMELKKLDGWDSTGKTITKEAFIKQYTNMMRKLFDWKTTEDNNTLSVFEVGCGSGPLLLLSENDGYKVGGMDYSESFVEIAKEMLDQPLEMYCDEAKNLETDIEYDVVFSNSAFEYFESEEYAKIVLEKMYTKAKKKIAVLDVLDTEKKDAFLAYRKKLNPDFEERYVNLDKLFLNKSFFEEFAKEHGAEVEFVDANLEGYWNNEFMYDCYITLHK